jgi:hypothetical protein
VTTEVVLDDRDPSGLALMLADLLRANLERDPSRARLVRGSTVQLHAVDAGVMVTVRLRPGRIAVADGSPRPPARLRIRADAQDLLALASAPLALGLPNPFDRRGRAMLGAVASGRVRISGLVRHPVALSRFARLLSVAG